MILWFTVCFDCHHRSSRVELFIYMVFGSRELAQEGSRAIWDRLKKGGPSGGGAGPPPET